MSLDVAYSYCKLSDMDKDELNESFALYYEPISSYCDKKIQKFRVVIISTRKRAKKIVAVIIVSIVISNFPTEDFKTDHKFQPPRSDVTTLSRGGDIIPGADGFTPKPMSSRGQPRVNRFQPKGAPLPPGGIQTPPAPPGGRGSNISRSLSGSSAGKSVTNPEADNAKDRNQTKLKGGISELPNSDKFNYGIETKYARECLKRIWKNSEAKKEVLSALDRMDRGELLPRNSKDFKGYTTLKEMKFTKTRMIVDVKTDPDNPRIVAICMRKELNRLDNTLKTKYK